MPSVLEWQVAVSILLMGNELIVYAYIDRFIIRKAIRTDAEAGYVFASLERDDRRIKEDSSSGNLHAVLVSTLVTLRGVVNGCRSGIAGVGETRYKGDVTKARSGNIDGGIVPVVRDDGGEVGLDSVTHYANFGGVNRNDARIEVNESISALVFELPGELVKVLGFGTIRGGINLRGSSMRDAERLDEVLLGEWEDAGGDYDTDVRCGLDDQGEWLEVNNRRGSCD